MASIEKVQDTPLAFKDLFRMLGPLASQTNFWLYEQLEKLTISEFLSKPFIILLIHQPREHVGHFFVILNKETSLEHFDPYAFTIDELLRLTNASPILKKLYKESRKKIIVNSIKFQKLNNDTDTCGRWCVSRIKLNHKNLNAFKNFFQQRLQTNDEKVTWLTYFL